MKLKKGEKEKIQFEFIHPVDRTQAREMNLYFVLDGKEPLLFSTEDFFVIFSSLLEEHPEFTPFFQNIYKSLKYIFSSKKI